MKKIISALLAFIILAFPLLSLAEGPELKHLDLKIEEDIFLDAQGAILINIDSGEIMYDRFMDRKLYPASITKVLTGLLALEYGNLEDMVTVGNEAFLCPMDSSKAGIDVGEEISLEKLIYGLMLSSGNDAAYVIAIHIGRKINNDPDMPIQEALTSFIDLMNSRSKELGANNSNFVTPDGYHDPDHYTTAYDMALISKEAMKSSVFREIVATTMYTMPDWSSHQDINVAEDDKETRYWRNTNLLIQPKENYYYPEATGVKTGYTSHAQHCLITSASKDGVDLLTVIMGSSKEGKWLETINLLDYGFDSYDIYRPFEPGQQIATLDVTNNPEVEWVRVIANDPSSYMIPKGYMNKITNEIEWNNDISFFDEEENEGLFIEAPLAQDQEVAKMIIKMDDHILDELSLVTNRSIKIKEETPEPSRDSGIIRLKNGIDHPVLATINNSSTVLKVGVGSLGIFIIILLFWLPKHRKNKYRYN